MRFLHKVFYIVLFLAIMSNAVVHINEVIKTRLNTTQTLANSIVINFSNKFIYGILGNHLNRIVDLEKREPIIIYNNIERQVPDFEKLMNGTVTIYNKVYVVAGVCIAEDESYYYILTVEHLLRNEERDTGFPKNAVPESSMGLATKLEAIALFLTDINIREIIPKKEIINTTVQTRDYISVAGEFMYVNSLLDLGLVRIYKGSGIKLETIKIANVLPEVGDEVYVLGHPLGRGYNLSKGIVSNLDRPFVMGVDALMTFGNSGGGVFNSKGELIGICSRVLAYSIEVSEEKKQTKEKLIDAI